MARLGRGFPATPITHGFSALMEMPAILAFTPAMGQASGTLANVRPLPMPFSPAAGGASASLTFVVPVELPLDAADPVAFAPLALKAPVALSLAPSSGVATDSLLLAGFPTFTLTSSVTTTTGVLPLKVTTRVSLAAGTAAATGSLSLAMPPLALGPSSAIASNSLALTAPPKPSLAVSGVATASLALSLLVQPVSVSLAPASASASTGTLVPTATTRARLDEANPRATTSLVLTAGGVAAPITRRGIGALADAVWPNVAGSDNMLTRYPAGVTAGDFNLLFVFCRSNSTTMTAPAGWTQVFNQISASAIGIAIFSRVYVGGDAEPVVDFGATGAGPRNSFIVGYTGVNTTTPINQMPATFSENAAAQNIGPIAGFTPASTVGAIVVFAAKIDDWTSVATLTGDGLTWNELVDAFTTAGNDGGMVANDALNWTSGAITSKTFTVTGGTALAGAGVMFGLNKAAGVTATEMILPLAGASGTATASLAVKAETQVPLQPVSAVASPTLALAISPQISLTASSAMATATLAPTVPAVAPVLPLQASASSATALTLAVSALTTLPFIAAGASAATATTLALTAPPLLSLTASPVATATGSLVVTPKLSLNVSGLSEGLLDLTAETKIPNLSSSATATATMAIATAAPTPIQVPLNIAPGSVTTSLDLAILVAAPVVVASVEHSTVAPTTMVSVTIPTTQAGDLLIFQYTCRVGTPEGHVIGGTYPGTLTLAEDIGTTQESFLGGYWSRATGNHSGQTVTFTNDTANSTAASMIVVRGALAVGNPIEASRTQRDEGTSASLTMTGITTTVANTLVVGMYFLHDNADWSNQQLGGLAMTERTQAFSSGGGDSAGGIATRSQASIGATGNFTWTVGTSGVIHRGIGFAIKPVVVTGVRHRIFDGSGSIGNSVLPINNLTGAFTLAAVVRRTDPTDVVMAILHTTSGFGATLQLSLAGTTGVLRVATGVLRQSTLALTQADGWGIIAVTKAAGTVVPRFHLYKSGSWSHEAAVGTIPNAVDHTGGATLFANSVLAEHIFDLAVAGEWNTALSDGDIETLDWASQNWAALAPLSLWNFDQTVTTDTIPDLVGGVDLAGNAGAPIGTDGPDGWDYTVAAEVTLSTAPAIAAASATLALNAPTRVTLAASSTTATATLALTATTQVPLQVAPAIATASLAVTAQTRVPLAASGIAVAASLSLATGVGITRRAVGGLGDDPVWMNLAGTDISGVPIPAGTVVGDFMVLFVFCRRGDIAIATPSGWTPQFNGFGASETSGIQLAVFTKFAEASESEPVIDFEAAGSGPRNAFIVSYTGVDTNDPIDQMPASVSFNAAAQNIGPIAGFTPASTVGAVIVFGGKADDWSADGAANLSGESLTWNELLEATTIEGSDAGMVVNDTFNWSGGAIADKTFTITGGTAIQNGGIMFGLNKAGVAAPINLPLGAASGTATASGTLTTSTQVPLTASSALATDSLALTAPSRVTLVASSVTVAASLALTAVTQVPLQAASATATASLTVTALTRIPLAASSTTATTTLALTAPTKITLAATSAVGTINLSLTATPKFSFTTSGTATATLALTAPAQVLLAPSSATATGVNLNLLVPGVAFISMTVSAIGTATLALKAPTAVPLAPVTVSATGTLALRATTRVPLNTASGITTASLALVAPTRLNLAAANAIGTVSAQVKAPSLLTLSPSSAVGTTSLPLKTITIVLLVPGSVIGSTDLLVRVPLRLTLSTSTGTLATFAQVDAFGAVLHEARPPTNFTVLSARLTQADVEQAVRVAIAPEAGVLTGANADVLLSAANPAPQADRDAVDLSPGLREASRDVEPVRTAVVLDAYDSES